MEIKFILIALFILVNIFDPLRDANWCDKSKSWLVKHIYKWLAFYPPLVFLALLFFNWTQIIILVIICFIVWNLSLRFIAKKKDWNKWLPF
jgi:hypothetical protein